MTELLVLNSDWIKIFNHMFIYLESNPGNASATNFLVRPL